MELIGGEVGHMGGGRCVCTSRSIAKCRTRFGRFGRFGRLSDGLQKLRCIKRRAEMALAPGPRALHRDCEPGASQPEGHSRGIMISARRPRALPEAAQRPAGPP
jgi:hypothetical protein